MRTTRLSRFASVTESAARLHRSCVHAKARRVVSRSVCRNFIASSTHCATACDAQRQLSKRGQPQRAYLHRISDGVLGVHHFRLRVAVAGSVARSGGGCRRCGVTVSCKRLRLLFVR